MAIIRKDKMLAGYNGNLESVIVHDAGGNPVEVTNGVFVKIEGLMEGQREVKKATLATEADVVAGEDIYLIHNGEVMYDERKYKLADFRIKAGKVARAYRLYDGDIVTLTDDLFVDATVDGDGKVTARPAYTAGDSELVVKADGKLGLADTVANPTILADAKVVFEVLEDSAYELDPQMQAFAVQIRRN